MERLNFEPSSDQVTVKPIKAEEKTTSGIFIPDTAKEKPNRGIVVAVGPGRYTENGSLIPMRYEAGDEILYGKYSGHEIELNGETLLIMREGDTYGRIVKEG